MSVKITHAESRVCLRYSSCLILQSDNVTDHPSLLPPRKTGRKGKRESCNISSVANADMWSKGIWANVENSLKLAVKLIKKVWEGYGWKG